MKIFYHVGSRRLFAKVVEERGKVSPERMKEDATNAKARKKVLKKKLKVAKAHGV
jgi:hypothetical protein